MSDETEREMNTQDDKFTKKSLKAVNCENKLILKIEHIRKWNPSFCIFFIYD